MAYSNIKWSSVENDLTQIFSFDGPKRDELPLTTKTSKIHCLHKTDHSEFLANERESRKEEK